GRAGLTSPRCRSVQHSARVPIAGASIVLPSRCPEKAGPSCIASLQIAQSSHQKGSLAVLWRSDREAPRRRRSREDTMETATLTRRTVLRTTALATTLATSFVRGAYAAGRVVPSGSMVLAWHTNIAPRWLDPLQHDGGATPDNFLNVLQDALIKNFREQLYDHLALAEHFEFAEDARSATFRLRPGITFHNGAPVTPEDVKWSYEHYHGAW